VVAKRKAPSGAKRAARGAHAGTEPLPNDFEAAMIELRAIVEALEADDGGLESAVAHYERGVAVQRRAEELLAAARLRVEELLPSGAVSPLDSDDDESDDDDDDDEEA
jgi:exodeoxyribonuclease VII small subunit